MGQMGHIIVSANLVFQRVRQGFSFGIRQALANFDPFSLTTQEQSTGIPLMRRGCEPDLNPMQWEMPAPAIFSFYMPNYQMVSSYPDFFNISMASHQHHQNQPDCHDIYNGKWQNQPIPHIRKSNTNC